MSHRDYVMLAFDKFMQGKDLKGMKILDVGCRGTALKKAMEERGLIWHGVDLNPKGEDVTQANMCKMPFEDGSYDIIFCCHALEHVELPLHALREMKRVMDPDGWMFIATPNPCEHQITKGDPDHIFVMNPMQMDKWFVYCEILIQKIYLQTDGIPREQDYNVISIGRKLNLG